MASDLRAISRDMVVRKSLRKYVIECPLIDSCDLELNEPVGQGTYVYYTNEN